MHKNVYFYYFPVVITTRGQEGTGLREAHTQRYLHWYVLLIWMWGSRVCIIFIYLRIFITQLHTRWKSSMAYVSHLFHDAIGNPLYSSTAWIWKDKASPAKRPWTNCVCNWAQELGRLRPEWADWDQNSGFNNGTQVNKNLNWTSQKASAPEKQAGIDSTGICGDTALTSSRTCLFLVSKSWWDSSPRAGPVRRPQAEAASLKFFSGTRWRRKQVKQRCLILA